MKNMTVGKKLGFGFGIVIALMVVILAVTTVTSLIRNNQLDEVAVITDMQTVAGSIQGEVYSAWVELRTVFTSNDYDEEYAAAVKSLNAGKSYVSQMAQLTEDLPESSAAPFRQANSALSSEFTDLLSALETLTANDAAIGESMTHLTEAAQEMAVATDALQDLIADLMVERQASEPHLMEYRMRNVMEPIIYLDQLVAEMRRTSAYFVLLMDTSVMDSVYSMLDEIEATVATLEPILTTNEAKAALATVKTTVATYRADADAVLTDYAKSEQLVAVARESLNELVAVTNTGVETIANSVNETLAGIIASAVAVLILTLIIVLLSIGIAAATAFALTRMFTRPLGLMQEVMKQAGEVGDLDFTPETRNAILKEAEVQDEIGQSLKVFAKFVDRIVYIAKALETVANRDLTVDVALLSSKDTMGNALKSMLDNLNNMFSEINNVAMQVSSSSSEVARGAQSLAQGSTEQASTVEEISASINEITTNSKHSSDKAEEVAGFSDSIRQTAMEGNKKMASMMSAVQEINDASQAIGDVIKIIDDIAFQTNILALNAAVEAARAGEHGKGFAVVADEVRNLAGKSAAAAKDTAGLISANIEKAGTGLAIAQETAENLGIIVDGIGQTSASLGEIAEESRANERATAQINIAVDQVAQVVQQNSATSEESAAASEEMSGQAQELQALIAQFKLRASAKSSSVFSSSPSMGSMGSMSSGYGQAPAPAAAQEVDKYGAVDFDAY